MEKRLPIFLVLTLGLLVGWTLLSNKLWPAPPPKPAPAATAPVDGDVPAGGSTANTPTSANAGALQNGAAQAPSIVSDGRADVSPRVGETEERTLVLDVGKPGEAGSYRAVFSNRGASLLELRLGNYYVDEHIRDDARLDWHNWTTVLASARTSGRDTGSLSLRTIAASDGWRREPLEQALWTMRPLDGNAGVEFELSPGLGVRFKKTARFVPGTYRIEVDLAITNEALDAPAQRTSFVFRPAEVVPLEARDRFYPEPLAVAAGRTPEMKSFELGEFEAEVPDAGGRRLKGSLDVPGEPLSYAGVSNKYFACLFRGADERSKSTLVGAAFEHLRDDVYAAGDASAAAAPYRLSAADVMLSLEVPAKGQTSTWKYAVFAGPKDRELLKAEHPDFETLTEHDLSYFNGIARLLLAILGFFHGLVGNWGVAIILLTLTVRLILFPINRKSQTAMARYQKKMKRVQPELDALKKKHANDPQKLRQEQAAMMQREGLFPPLGGCLPIFLQIPVFFGLFSALRTAIELRQSPFCLWMTDLAKPDRFMELGWNLPFGIHVEHLNLLPPLMVVLWVWQQLLMPKPTDEQQAKIQKLMVFMPIMMGFFLYEYAAGLSLYMITQSIFGILEMTVVKKIWPIDDREQPPSKGGIFAKLAKLHEEQQKKLAARTQTQKPGDKKTKKGK
ncbi:MAG: membrane protein insertase YidC [Planctomycetes bacterium]|nr:membrane protein insertase YidC [Planctomycetota bacterium]